MRRSLTILAVLLLLSTTSNAASHKSHHHPKRAPSLSQGQKNGLFTTVAYANAYDEFGREILRENHRVKEVAESNRDAENGFYIMLKAKTVSQSEARRLAKEYYYRFVAVRSAYFDSDTAQRCDVDIRTADDEIVADCVNGEVGDG